ncbi:zinc-binding dehydrogenase [Phytomonospora endophytica]|uniref:NADPH2:quinone reductase n=1 Tax=Phytomonospora endophytica TaxID=714109 RepID=A0A841FVK1_9ACTN|nr:zinc-binding dehydrogenase [Phytomonospora endophytica]MBB6037367.1 NADPH2:quinone reductase [Phytomonospora endophytica]GIG69891.1 oxidoreductase [Phytomonospora endophytica]
MRVIRLHEYGPAQNLRLEEAPDPAPEAGRVRVRIAASGVQLLETWLREGKRVGPHPAPKLPAVLGGEVAGVVDALGEGVPAGLLGQRVALGLDHGGYAEYVLARPEDLHPLPAGLGTAEAVAMLNTGVTAHAVWDLAEAGPGDVVLVTAAAGGIGGQLVQLAKASGATVVGLAGGEAKLRLVREAGADAAVDYREPGWPDRVAEAVGSVTVALDGVGGEIAAEAWRLADRGVSFGAAADNGDIGGELPDGVRSLFTAPVMADFGNPEATRRHVARAFAAAAEGRVRTPVSAYPLAEAAEAHRAMAARETIGKVVLLP